MVQDADGGSWVRSVVSGHGLEVLYSLPVVMLKACLVPLWDLHVFVYNLWSYPYQQ